MNYTSDTKLSWRASRPTSNTSCKRPKKQNWPGLILSPTLKTTAPGHTGQYTSADIDQPADQNPAFYPLRPLFVIKTYSKIGLESLLFSAFGFAAGLGLWLFYRLVKFAVQG
jgi:hypothetical protein